MKVTPTNTSMETSVNDNTIGSIEEGIEETGETGETGEDDEDTNKQYLLGHTLDTFSLMKKRIPSFIFSIHLLLYSSIFDEYND